MPRVGEAMTRTDGMCGAVHLFRKALHMKIIVFAAVAASAVGCAADSSDKVLPVDRMQSILGFEGHVSHGVLDISVPCPEIGRVDGPRGTVFTPSFQLHGELFFQPLASGNALLNGEMALKTEEVDPFIAALIQHDCGPGVPPAHAFQPASLARALPGHLQPGDARPQLVPAGFCLGSARTGTAPAGSIHRS